VQRQGEGAALTSAMMVRRMAVEVEAYIIVLVKSGEVFGKDCR